MGILSKFRQGKSRDLGELIESGKNSEEDEENEMNEEKEQNYQSTSESLALYNFNPNDFSSTFTDYLVHNPTSISVGRDMRELLVTLVCEGRVGSLLETWTFLHSQPSNRDLTMRYTLMLLRTTFLEEQVSNRHMRQRTDTFDLTRERRSSGTTSALEEGELGPIFVSLLSVALEDQDEMIGQQLVHLWIYCLTHIPYPSIFDFSTPLHKLKLTNEEQEEKKEDEEEESEDKQKEMTDGSDQDSLDAEIMENYVEVVTMSSIARTRMDFECCLLYHIHHKGHDDETDHTLVTALTTIFQTVEPTILLIDHILDMLIHRQISQRNTEFIKLIVRASVRLYHQHYIPSPVMLDAPIPAKYIVMLHASGIHIETVRNAMSRRLLKLTEKSAQKWRRKKQREQRREKRKRERRKSKRMMRSMSGRSLGIEVDEEEEVKGIEMITANDFLESGTQEEQDLWVEVVERDRAGDSFDTLDKLGEEGEMENSDIRLIDVMTLNRLGLSAIKEWASDPINSERVKEMMDEARNDPEVLAQIIHGLNVKDLTAERLALLIRQAPFALSSFMSRVGLTQDPPGDPFPRLVMKLKGESAIGSGWGIYRRGVELVDEQVKIEEYAFKGEDDDILAEKGGVYCCRFVSPFDTSILVDKGVLDAFSDVMGYNRRAADALVKVPLFRALFVYLWEMGGLQATAQLQSLYLLFVISTTSAITVMSSEIGRIEELGTKELEFANTSGQFRVWLIFSLCCTFYIAKLQLHQLRHQGDQSSYWRALWNVGDLAGVILWIFALAIFYFQGDRTLLRGICSVVVLLIWSRTLFFGRGFRSYSGLVRVLITIVHDVKFFALLLCIFLLTFAASFRALNVTDSLTSALLLTFSMMIGEFDIKSFFVGSWLSLLALLLFVGFVITVTIIMLNSLIAIMGDSYEKAQEKARLGFLVERGRLTLEYHKLGWLRYRLPSCGEDNGFLSSSALVWWVIRTVVPIFYQAKMEREFLSTKRLTVLVPASRLEESDIILTSSRDGSQLLAGPDEEDIEDLTGDGKGTGEEWSGRVARVMRHVDIRVRGLHNKHKELHKQISSIQDRLEEMLKAMQASGLVGKEVNEYESTVEINEANKIGSPVSPPVRKFKSGSTSKPTVSRSSTLVRTSSSTPTKEEEKKLDEDDPDDEK